MKRFLPVSLLLLAIAFCGNGQVNFVVNPGFEILTSCPNNSAQIDSAIGWGILQTGGGGTPDIYNVCCTNPSICGVPYQSNFQTSQYPHAGNGYAGEYAYFNDIYNQTPNYREYIQCKLISKLNSGEMLRPKSRFFNCPFARCMLPSHRAFRACCCAECRPQRSPGDE